MYGYTLDFYLYLHTISCLRNYLNAHICREQRQINCLEVISSSYKNKPKINLLT